MPAKGVNVIVPLLYKHAVDALTPGHVAAIAAVPVMLVVAYGVARVLAQVFGRTARRRSSPKSSSARCAAWRSTTFRHLHALSLRFHLERQTGGLSRAIERGIARHRVPAVLLLFNFVPTMFEILLVCGILWRLLRLAASPPSRCRPSSLYVAFTFTVTDWRVKFRREMNERDSEANTKAIDSLLNYETVKYFANEEHEARRFDARAAGLRDAPRSRAQTTLTLLNIGQGIIIADRPRRA